MYTKIKNENIHVLKDAFALGVYCYLNTIDSDIEISKEDICNHFKTGMFKVRNAFRKLKEHELIDYIKIRDNGRISKIKIVLKG